jgi:hypothetical protein
MGQAAADVAAAGFNTCALYSDWTTQIPNNVGSGLPSNWLNDNKAGWDGVSRWYCGQGFVNDDTFVCNMFSQVTDPVFGNLALRVRAGGNTPRSLSFATVAYNNSPPYGLGTFPDGAYYEMRFRYSTSDIMNLYAMGLWGNPVDWLGCPTSSSKGFLEEDFYQLGVGVGGDAVSPSLDWFGCGDTGRFGGGIQTFGQDMTQYHTVGWLSTSAGDSGGNFAVCMYWDGQRRGCTQDRYNDPVEYMEHRWIGHEWRTCNEHGIADKSCRALPWPIVDTYIQYIKVLSCPNWLQSGDAGSCHGSTLNAAGFYQ